MAVISPKLMNARVRSPSFSIVNEYHGRLLLLHLDLYRLAPADVETLGLEEYLERGALVVEWGDRLPTRHLAEALIVRLEGEGETRTVTATATGGRGTTLLATWSRATDTAAAEPR